MTLLPRLRATGVRLACPEGDEVQACGRRQVSRTYDGLLIRGRGSLEQHSTPCDQKVGEYSGCHRVRVLQPLRVVYL